MTAGGSRGFDARVAHPARVYDYWLGGKDNFEADRIAGEATIAAYPAIRASARANRAFLARSVRYLAAEAGLRQFLDIGTGLPTANNTHEVAQSVAPESRIVYVDNDPLVLSHARALLTSSPEGVTAYLDADLRDTDRILKLAADTLDFSQPVAIMLLAILHYIPDTGRGAADRGPPGQRPSAGQLPDDLARGQRHLGGGDGRDVQADERAPGRERTTSGAPGTWSRSSSTAWTWWSRAWSRSPSGARGRSWRPRGRPRCGAAWDASRDPRRSPPRRWWRGSGTASSGRA